nr:hypothetical protein [Tanacetum cinerariifolium]
MHALVEWKLYDMCRVHQVISKDKEIFMLVEKDYPLRKGLAIRMISYKLQVETYSKMANDLILKIYKIASSPSQQGSRSYSKEQQKGTPTLGLYYPKWLGFDLKGYIDSDYAGCNMDKNHFSDYNIHYKMAPIFCDNTSAIAISNNPVLHLRTKNIDIRHHFIGDHILKRDIELHFMHIENQLGDIFTKPLDEPTFNRLKAEIGMLNID